MTVKVETFEQAIISIRQLPNIHFEKEVGQSTDEADDCNYHSWNQFMAYRPTTKDEEDDSKRNGSNCDAKFCISDTDNNDQRLNLITKD